MPADGLVAVALVAAAVFVRRGPLGPRSLWLDDAWPALVTRLPWSKLRVVGLTSPGYSAVLKAWVGATGFTETHAQLPAFAFGVLGPAAVYWAARRMSLNRLAALVAAVSLVVSREHVIYSTRVKQYTLDALLSTLVILLALWVLDRPASSARWGLLVATAIVATGASSLVFPTVCGAFAAGLVRAWRTRNGKKVALAWSGVYAVFAAGWWAVALRPRITPTLHTYWAAFYIRLNIAFPRDLGVALLRVALGFSFAPSGVTLAVLIVSAIVVARRRDEIAILLLAPISVAILLAMAHAAPLGDGRTDINLYPSLALLLGFAVVELQRHVRLSAILAVLLVALVFTVRVAPAYPSEDMRGAARYLEATARPSDPVLVYWAGRFPFALYSRKWPLTVRSSKTTAEGFEVQVGRSNLYVLPNDVEHRGDYAAAVARLTAGQDRVWFIGSHGRLDVTTIERDLKALGYRSHRRRGDTFHTFVTLWTKTKSAS